MKIQYIIFLSVSIYQIYSEEKIAETLNPNIKIGIYSIGANPIHHNGGLYSFLNTKNKDKSENKEGETKKEEVIKEKLNQQNISSEFLNLYQKIPWLSKNIKQYTKMPGLSTGL